MANTICAFKLNVLYEDSFVMAVEKPVGMPASADESGCDVSELVLEHLRARDEDDYAALINQLEQPYGGILLYARDKDSTTELMYDYLNNKLTREYLAVVNGRARRNWIIRNNLLEREQKLHVVPKNTPNAREILLTYDTIDKIDTSEYGPLSLITAEAKNPAHIRAILANAGLPVWGDNLYNPKSHKTGRLSVALWGYRLTFNHPKTGKTIRVELMPKTKLPFTLFKLTQ